jgi:hypothetical protein
MAISIFVICSDIYLCGAMVSVKHQSGPLLDHSQVIRGDSRHG